MIEVTEKELKECPFCGSDTVNDTRMGAQDNKGGFYWVCPDCICVGPFSETEEGAAIAWNKRPISMLEAQSENTVSVDKRIDELQQEIDELLVEDNI